MSCVISCLDRIPLIMRCVISCLDRIPLKRDATQKNIINDVVKKTIKSSILNPSIINPDNFPIFLTSHYPIIPSLSTRTLTILSAAFPSHNSGIFPIFFLPDKISSAANFAFLKSVPIK